MLKHIQRNLDIELRGVTHCLNLKHPNLLAIHDIKYDEHGDGWVVMEFIAGESMKDVVDRNPNGVLPNQLEMWFTGLAGSDSAVSGFARGLLDSLAFTDVRIENSERVLLENGDEGQRFRMYARAETR